jgi:hypothetical protein
VNTVAAITIEALGGTPDLEAYFRALDLACEASKPIFSTKRYGDIFRSVAVDPAWLAASLITNAEREAEGSTRLWSLSASTRDAETARLVKQHAIDESRHARWYIAILDLVFPGALDASLRPHVESISPRYSSSMEPKPEEGSPYAHEITLDDLVQMNIAEIRTAINQRLQLPILMAHCNPVSRDKLRTLLEGLMNDEWLHVGYSARLIERMAAEESGDFLQDLMTARVCDFNEITCEEVELGVFPLHCSNKSCPRLHARTH